MRLGGSLGSRGLDNMSKSLLNGNSTGAADASEEDDAATMVAAIQDHIASCAKLQESNYTGIEIKEERFSCDFDHMYASMAEHDSAAVAAEVRQLKDLLLLHLDLIQQQSEQIVNKDKQLQTLRQENEMLRLRLERMDRRVTLHHNKRQSAEPPSEAGTVARESTSPSTVTELPANEDDTTTTSAAATTTTATTTTTTSTSNTQPFPKVEGSLSPRGSPLTVGNKQLGITEPRASRSRKSSWSSDTGTAMSRRSTSSVSDAKASAETPATSTTVSLPKRSRVNQSRRQTNDTEAAVPDAVEPEPKRLRITMPSTTVKTPVLYYCPTPDTDDKLESREQSQQALLEVPRWRIKQYTSCYSMEGTENLEDEVFLKRHQRLELDERRRKRWDIQRLREQRQYEKLRQRQSQQQSGIGGRRANVAARRRNQPQETAQLWPDPENVQFIEVDEFLPVTAFGVPVPAFLPTVFELPWITDRESLHAAATNSESNTNVKQEQKEDAAEVTPAPPPPSPELPPPPPPQNPSSRTRCRRRGGTTERRRTSARRR